MISTLSITAAIRKTHICTRWTFNSTFDSVRFDRVALLSCLILDHRLRPANDPRQPLAPRSAATRPERSPGCLGSSSSGAAALYAEHVQLTGPPSWRPAPPPQRPPSMTLHLGQPHPVVWMVGPGTTSARHKKLQKQFQASWDKHLSSNETHFKARIHFTIAKTRCQGARVSPWHLFVTWRPLKAHCATLRKIVMRI